MVRRAPPFRADEVRRSQSELFVGSPYSRSPVCCSHRTSIPVVRSRILPLGGTRTYSAHAAPQNTPVSELLFGLCRVLDPKANSRSKSDLAGSGFPDDFAKRTNLGQVATCRSACAPASIYPLHWVRAARKFALDRP